MDILRWKFDWEFFQSNLVVKLTEDLTDVLEDFFCKIRKIREIWQKFDGN